MGPTCRAFPARIRRIAIEAVHIEPGTLRKVVGALMPARASKSPARAMTAVEANGRERGLVRQELRGFAVPHVASEPGSRSFKKTSQMFLSAVTRL
jgi:hypothetical protein